MSYGEDILKLRKRMQDAVLKGVVSKDGKDIFEATLLQIMNDAERNRQNCLTQAENLRKQAATVEGQAGAFASVTSIVYNVLNGFVSVAEKDEAERSAEEAEKAGDLVADVPEEKAVNQKTVKGTVDKKKSGKKKS